jgi:hypothetical protein
LGREVTAGVRKGWRDDERSKGIGIEDGKKEEETARTK